MPTESFETPRWIAYELHDGLLQWVIGAKLQAEAAMSEAAGEGERSDLRSRLADIQRYLDLAISDGRGLIGFLERQSDLRAANLIAQLTRLVASLQTQATANSQQLSAELETGIPESISPIVAWNLYRIVQQAIQNAIKHAGPASITVRSRWRDANETVSADSASANRQLELEVEDSGVGFDASHMLPHSEHFGLTSLRYRAEQIDGQLDILAQPGQGCTVRVRVPLVDS